MAHLELREGFPQGPVAEYGTAVPACIGDVALWPHARPSPLERARSALEGDTRGTRDGDRLDRHVAILEEPPDRLPSHAERITVSDDVRRDEHAYDRGG